MISIRSIDLFRAPLRARMTFRYGIAAMTELPHIFLRLELDVDGQRATGLAADHLPPKWFTKDPERDPVEEIDDMLAVIRQACGFGLGLGAETPFALWRELREFQENWRATVPYPPLLAHFGTSMVERGVLDAFCRARGEPFARVLRENTLGMRLESIHPELAGSAPADWLPAEPLREVLCRHTVGLSDPLEDADISPEERLDDGLPQSLEACIAHYGLRHFKIKFNTDTETGGARLRRIFEVIQRAVGGPFAFSLDGNESFHDGETFRQWWDALVIGEKLLPDAGELLYVEQPFHRSVALSEDVGAALKKWNACPPIIIDESDGELHSLRRALDLGFAGTSHKNCKGLFQGIANACLLAWCRRQGRPVLMSGEDLINIGPVALPQDLSLQANLGNASVERNGHHYFAGLSFWPRAIQEAMLENHGDLYAESAAGWPALAITNGVIQVGSVVDNALGCAPELDLSPFEALHPG